MKKITLLLTGLLFAAAGLLASCENDDVPAPEADELELGTDRVKFQYDQLTSQQVGVETNAAGGFDHEITAGDWFRVENIEKAIRITPLSANDSEEDERMGTIKVTAGSATPKTITVTQSEKGVVVVEDELKVSTNQLKFAYDELSARNVTVTTNVQAGFKAEITEGDWFEFDYTESGISVTPLSENPDRDNERTGTITVTAGEADPEIIDIIQTRNGVEVPDPYLEVDPELIEYLRGEAITPHRVEVDTNIDEGYTLEISPENDWIKIVEEQNDHFTVSVDEWNYYRDREGEVTVRAGEFEHTVTIVQYATVDMEFRFEAVGTFDPSDISSDAATIVYVESPSTTYDGDYEFVITRWAGADPTDVRAGFAYGNQTFGQDPARRYLTIDVTENLTEEHRSFSVRITAVEDPTLDQTLEFTRQGAEADDMDLLTAISEADWWMTAADADNYFGGEWGFSNQTVYFNRVFNQDRLQVFFEIGDGWFGGEELMIVFEVRDGNRLFSLDGQYGNTMRDYRSYMAAVGMFGDSEDTLGRDVEWEYDFDDPEPWIRPMPLTLQGGEEADLAVRFAPASNSAATEYSIYNLKFTKL